MTQKTVLAITLAIRVSQKFFAGSTFSSDLINILELSTNSNLSQSILGLLHKFYNGCICTSSSERSANTESQFLLDYHVK
jgi:hypothetical protein